jgi:hypothetical protein
VELERFANACTGLRARVVFSRFLPDWTQPQSGRLNKSPHTIHAFANRYNRMIWNVPVTKKLVIVRRISSPSFHGEWRMRSWAENRGGRTCPLHKSLQ